MKGPSRRNKSASFSKNRKPSFNNAPTFNRPNSNRQSLTPRASQVSKDVVAKSHESIKRWLEAGAELRSNQSSSPQPAQDPKTLSLDPWQQEVFDRLRAGESVIVDAPTTAGKTRAVEVFFAQNLHDPSFRAAYTTPVKSLSNDKVRELRAMFGDQNVGISTGDIKENLDAPIVVATLESYRNSLLGVEPDLGRSLVIFDEYHYLQDEGRGSAWEESIILTPPSCQLLLLSASVANADQFAEWISSLGKRRCTLVQTLHRPVPLTSIIYYSGHWLTEDTLPAEAKKHLNPMLREKPLKHEDLVKSLPGLIDLNLTPCIVYAGKRFDCENLATLIEKNLPPLPTEHATRIGNILQKVHEEVGALSFIKPAMRRMIQTYGVGYHHSGLAPAARIAIERLVKEGQLRFCVATMGLSLGINFSVRSALIADYQRPGEGGMTPFADGEILQMLGRAGRRGKDVVGFSLWPTAESYVRMGNAKREPCSSRLKTDPTTLLGLIGRGLSLGTIEGIYGKSFMKFQQKKTDLRLVRKSDVENKLGNAKIPCRSPASAFAHYNQGLNSSPFDRDRPEISESRHETSETHSVGRVKEHFLATNEAEPETFEQPQEATYLGHADISQRATVDICQTCSYLKPCHSYISYRLSGRLAAMHVHLHNIGCITEDETLTTLGSIARYFPQSGGLLISRMILDGRIKATNLIQAAELAAALCLPRFKEPGGDNSYKFPFDKNALEKELQDLYPLSLFPEAYDQPYGRRTWIQIKEWNPAAGWIVKQWLTGMEWKDLVRLGTTEYFGVGDLMGLMYRIATYLQSMAGMGVSEFKATAPALRREMMRSPLDLTL